MKLINTGVTAGLVLAFQGLAFAQEEAPKAEEATSSEATSSYSYGTASAESAAEARAHAEQARAEASRASSQARAAARAEATQAYEAALKTAEVEQRAALKAVETARKELSQRAEVDRQRALEQRETARESREVYRDEQIRRTQEMREVQRELERAHDNLKRASQSVARVHRDISHPRAVVAPSAPGEPGAHRVPHAQGYSFSVSSSSSSDPVIGVILGMSAGVGVEVLGVSPGGPAEAAGLEPGDLIVSMMGESLADDDQSPRDVLEGSLDGMQVGDELVIGIERSGALHEYIVVPEKREPVTWHSVSRLSSTDGPSRVIRIDVPEIDSETLSVEMERIQGELADSRVIINSDRVVHLDSDEEIIYDFEEFSDLGNSVIAGTNIWFGMPMTQGIKMAEMGEELGAYFNTERGVLILEAKDDNALQLKAGDVILSVDGTEVDKPADVMRALRNMKSGSEVEIDIKRERQDESLIVELPEGRLGFHPVPLADHSFTLDLAPSWQRAPAEELHEAN